MCERRACMPEGQEGEWWWARREVVWGGCPKDMTAASALALAKIVLQCCCTVLCAQRAAQCCALCWPLQALDQAVNRAAGLPRAMAGRAACKPRLLPLPANRVAAVHKACQYCGQGCCCVQGLPALCATHRRPAVCPAARPAQHYASCSTCLPSSWLNARLHAMPADVMRAATFAAAACCYYCCRLHSWQLPLACCAAPPMHCGCAGTWQHAHGPPRPHQLLQKCAQAACALPLTQCIGQLAGCARKFAGACLPGAWGAWGAQHACIPHPTLCLLTSLTEIIWPLAFFTRRSLRRKYLRAGEASGSASGCKQRLPRDAGSHAWSTNFHSGIKLTRTCSWPSLYRAPTPSSCTLWGWDQTRWADACPPPGTDATGRFPAW